MDAESAAREASPAGVDDGQHDETKEVVAGEDSDLESIISEIDEKELEEYDVDAAQLESRAVQIDEDIARSLKARKRTDGDGGQPRRPRERRREKRNRDEDTTTGGDGDAKRRRRNAGAGRGAGGRGAGGRGEKAGPPPDKDEDLTPDERRRRALAKAMDLAMKNNVKRRKKKDEVDLEDAIDEQLADLRVKMEHACRLDNAARKASRPAIHKLKLLPDVVAILRRDNAQSAVVDPESNFLQAVKFFLEPLDDASLPAFNIQRDILLCLRKMALEKESLIQSGLGKIVLHYTKSNQPQPQVKRMAEKLVEEWSRPILKRSHDYRKRRVETREFDADAWRASHMTLTQRPAVSRQEAQRARVLAPRPFIPGRAEIGGLPASYTIAPKSTIDISKGGQRPIGADGVEAFKRMTQKKGRKA